MYERMNEKNIFTISMFRVSTSIFGISIFFFYVFNEYCWNYLILTICPHFSFIICFTDLCRNSYTPVPFEKPKDPICKGDA